jgi:ribokinase
MVPPRGSQEHVAVGNINIDITLRVPRLPRPEENLRALDHWISLGGAASNYAIAVSRLGQRALLVARAGREAVALGLLEKLRSNGVDLSYVEVCDEPSGVVVVLLSQGPQGSFKSMVTFRGANEGLNASMLPDRGDVTHLASVTPELVLEACRPGRLCTYDPGGEAFRDPEWVARASTSVDYLFLNTRELEAVTGDNDPLSAASLIKGRLKMVVVKHGSGGAALVDSGGLVARAEAPRVKPIDVTGAGDAFDAAFNAWLLWRRDPVEALRAGVAAGTAKVARRGSSNMPYLEDIAEILDRVKAPHP